MASGGGGGGGGNGSSFNPFKKKGRLLTPKLLRKREPSPTAASDDQPVVPVASPNLDQSSPTPEQPSTSSGASPHDEPVPSPVNLSSSTDDILSPDTTNVKTAKKKSKTLTLRRKKTEPAVGKQQSSGAKFWTFKIKKRVPHKVKNETNDATASASNESTTSCVCTSYRRTEESQTPTPGIRYATPATSLMGASASPIQPNSSRSTRLALGAGPGPTGVRRFNPQLFQLVPAPQQQANTGFIDFSRPPTEEFPTEDIDEMMIEQRARDMELGIEISPSHFAYPHLHYSSSVSSSSSGSGSSTVGEQGGSLSLSFQNQCVVTTTTIYPGGAAAAEEMISRESSCRASVASRESEYGEFSSLGAGPSAGAASGGFIPRTVHTQVDYIHCLVPDLVDITKCTFYWGVIDRYEAERLLENRPEGTFLLRDSAQEEFLFSVSFRRYGRSLHARIEQWNHKFSFDSHDPGVFASDTVCGLIEHYKDPSCCMFFEPMLTNPLHRTFPFSLQHLCRTVICRSTTYDGVNFLPLPKSLRDYLKYYHYKQKVRVRRFEVNH